MPKAYLETITFSKVPLRKAVPNFGIVFGSRDGESNAEPLRNEME
jgi:hypothetical protein